MKWMLRILCLKSASFRLDFVKIVKFELIFTQFVQFEYLKQENSQQINILKDLLTRKFDYLKNYLVKPYILEILIKNL